MYCTCEAIQPPAAEINLLKFIQPVSFFSVFRNYSFPVIPIRGFRVEHKIYNLFIIDVLNVTENTVKSLRFQTV